MYENLANLSVLAFLLDERAYLLRGRKDDRCPITPHARLEDRGFSLRGTVFAGVGLEAEIKFPERVCVAGPECNEITISAVANGGDLLFRCEGL